MVTQKSQPNAWMTVTFVLAGLLVLSIIGNIAIVGMSFGALVNGGTIAPSNAAAPSPAAAPSGTAPTAPAPTPSVDVSADDDPFLGSEDAPVTVIEFSDYECPFCGRFYSGALAQIKSEYVDTGKVKFVYRDFPLSFHPRATPAAIAAECVREQGGDEAYFEMHDTLFENQQALDDASLRTHASNIVSDMSAWDTCYADADGSKAAEVQADFAAGQAAGVSGTPTVFVNGQKIVGAQPFSVFKAAIDAELA